LQGLLRKKENAVHAFLGPDGRELYTIKTIAAKLKAQRLKPQAANPNAEYLFCPHWSGLLGIYPGTACGDEPLEVFHRPWASQLLDVRGKDSEVADLLDNMQTLHEEWDDQCEWSSTSRLRMQLPLDAGAVHAQGAWVQACGRHTGYQLGDGSRNRRMHAVRDINDYFQIFAFVSKATLPFDEDRCAAAVAMLNLHGDALLSAIKTICILQGMRTRDHVLVPDCVSLKAVQAHFLDIALVLVRPHGNEPWPTFKSRTCTCSRFGFYGGRERVGFSNMLSLRLFPASVAPRTCLASAKEAGKRDNV